MMELMEPLTYILDAQSRKLKDTDKWKNSLGIEDFLAATCHKSLHELKEVNSLSNPGKCFNGSKHDFLPQEPLGTCLASHVFCALRAANLGDWGFFSVP